MATIQRCGKYWRVQIRKRGYPYLSATFDTKAEATAWAFKKEAELDRQTPAEVCQRLEARAYRLADALLRYELDVLPDKKPTTQRRELGILADLKATFGDLALSEINGQRLALMVKHWERPSEAHPKGLGPHSIRLYLALISHLYILARSEWGDVFPANRMLGVATIDRLRHGAYRLILEGESYRAPRPLPETPKKAVAKHPKIAQS